MAETLEAPARARFEAHGASIELLSATAREVLYEGAANTGKTRTVLEKCRMLMEDPNIRGLRMLWVRKTRKSLTQSVLVTWEQHVIPHDHPCKVGTAQRENRDHYYNAATDCEIVLGGMDNPDRIMSTEYDVICYFEATEGALDEWEKLLTRARNKRVRLGYRENGQPVYWHQLIADCNPGAETHWLNQRAKEGTMQRIKAMHKDNPVFTQEDQEALDALTGARRKRLRDGLWVSEEGQIWETWNAREMMCFKHELLWNKDDPSEGWRPTWFFGAIDFGFRHAGVFQVWAGMDGRMYRVAEVYKREKNIEWWAGAIERQLNRFDMEGIVADSAEPGLIEYLNDRLGTLAGREEDPLVRPVDKKPGSRLEGFSKVADELTAGNIILCHDALEEGPCKVSLKKRQPTCTEDEIPSFTWRKSKDGQPVKEDSDPMCVDDGCFAMIYAARYFWSRDLEEHKEQRYEPGSMGDFLEHGEVWDKIEGDDDEDKDDELLGPEFDDWGNLN